MPTVRNIASACRFEIPKVKASRFVASVEHAGSRESALAFIDQCREEFRGASHNCFAWRVGQDENGFRYSDDGEPSGTAGRPILQEIDGRGLTDVVVVVTRYFGGTKLGTGGLLRAYSEAASAGLDRAGIVETRLTRSVRLRFGYELTGVVQGVLNAFAVVAEKSSYSDVVEMEAGVAREDVERFCQALRDATAGQIRLT